MDCALQRITYSQTFVRESEKRNSIAVILKIADRTLSHSRQGFKSYDPLSGLWPRYENMKIRQDA
jgi:hypothetical protein